MSNVVQFRRTTGILTLVAASIGGGLIAAFAVMNHSSAPVAVVARADTNSSQRAVSQLSNSFADIIEKASPAVVEISMTRVIKASEQQSNNPFLSDPFFRQFFGGQGFRPRDQREEGLGSGVIISPAGYIVTNNHVVDKATSLKVTLSDGRDFPAKLVGADPQTDVAVVKINASDLPTMPFANSDGARVGDLCFAIGNPFGQSHTVTMGIVSAKGRNLRESLGQIQDFIQTDASINPGNSGGALINARGEMIGMNTMILTGGGASFGGEAGNIGIGFAVPSNLTKQVMDQLMKGGKVSRGYIGVTLQSVSPEVAQQFGLKDTHAALITQVVPGKPGDKAGLKQGDVIVGIDGQKIEDSNDLTLKVTEHAPGSTVMLDVIRNGQPMKVNVTLGQRPTAVNFDEQGGRGNSGDNNSDNGSAGNVGKAYGLTVETLTSDLTQQLQLPANTHGVVIDSVDPDSPAADVVGRGDVIMGVNRHPVNNVDEFERLMSEAHGKPALLTVNRGGAVQFVVVQPK
jgi:Do/DeqQ family serine protease